MPGANPATRWLRGGPAGQLPSFAPTLHRSRLIGLFAGNRKSRPELPIRTVNAFLLAGCDSLHRRIDDDSLIFPRGDALLEISRTRVVLSHFGQGPNYNTDRKEYTNARERIHSRYNTEGDFIGKNKPKIKNTIFL